MTIAALPPSTLAPVKMFGEPHLHTDGELLALAFAPDGSLWSVEEPGVLRHWNARTGQQLDWQSLSDLETIWGFSSDARVLISASDDLSFWDTSSGQVLTAVAQPSWVTALANHPDPAHIATGHDDGVVRYWDAAGHHLVCELSGSNQPVSALAFSPDGKLLAVAYEDRLIILWDVAHQKVLSTLTGHTDRIPALAWHPSGQFLVSAGWDTTARVWDVKTGQAVILLNSHSGMVTSLAFSPDGSQLACGDSALTVRIWDFAAKKEMHVLKGPQAEVHCLTFSRDGKLLAGNGDHVIHLWDVRSGQPLAGSQPRLVSKISLSLSPDGTRLANNGGGLAPRIWNVATSQSILTLETRGPVHDLAFSPSGTIIAGAAEKNLRLWHAETGRVKLDQDGPEDPLTALAFSKDGSLLATGSSTGLAVWLWRVSDGEPILIIPDALDGCAVLTLAFHPTLPLVAVGGVDWLATGGSSGAVSLWNYEQRCEVATFLGGTVNLVFHPSGTRLASTSLDESICIWDVESKQFLLELTGHDGPVTCLAYSPDGKWLVSGGEDRTIRIWDEEGQEVVVHELDTQPCSLVFSPDGQFLFTANANTTCCQFKVADLLRR